MLKYIFWKVYSYSQAAILVLTIAYNTILTWLLSSTHLLYGWKNVIFQEESQISTIFFKLSQIDIEKLFSNCQDFFQNKNSPVRLGTFHIFQLFHPCSLQICCRAVTVQILYTFHLQNSEIVHWGFSIFFFCIVLNLWKISDCDINKGFDRHDVER